MLIVLLGSDMKTRVNTSQFVARAAAAALVALVTVGTVPALAQTPGKPLQFSHKNWEMACDNSGTCRAAGFSVEGVDEESGASIRLSRAAGPNSATAVAVRTTVGPTHSLLGLKVGDYSLALSGVKEGQDLSLSAAEVAPLLAAMTRAQQMTLQISVGSVPKSLIISLDGLNAVLLKVDEAQGRLGTPGAWLRKGAGPETAVPSARALPQVKAVKAHNTKPLPASVARAIYRSLPRSSERCPANAQPQELAAYQLTATTVLLHQVCAMGAYNDGGYVWLAKLEAPHQPQPLKLPGDDDAAPNFFEPERGMLMAYAKGRGLGDCNSEQRWHFDGQRFVLTLHQHDRLCRGFTGGAWSLPLWLTRVQEPQ